MTTDIPVLPLRGVVVFPHGIQPLFVGTKRSIRAVRAATARDKSIFLVAKRDGEVADPGAEDLFEVGTVATVLQLVALPDGKVKVLVEGGQRAAVVRLDATGAHLVADVEPLEAPRPAAAFATAVTRSVFAQFERFAKTAQVPEDMLASVSSIDDPSRLLDTIAAQVPLKLEARQKILASADLEQRAERLLGYLEAEIDARRLDRRIRGRVKKQLERSQREYYLNEQMKAIHKELGHLSDAPDEFDGLKRRIEEAKLPKAARQKAESELAKLKQMAPMAAEATVVRGYLDWLLAMPWRGKKRVRRDLGAARRVLDEDHYGLDDVKERVVEHLAVQARVRKAKGPVLCLVGAPGVGKTSLGQSIARATNRAFVRMALGGVRDEAEIRGHRRTYIGALPGKVMQKMAKAGVGNPLFLLDEVDKMGMDMRGDPASALLEVLDPEQNHAFNDHYLEVDYDLSDVFFVCTSNSMDIPPALLDRMEVIRLAGYTEDEKRNIAARFLVPKQRHLCGLAEDELRITPRALDDLIRHYTREAGVRGLEREIAKICRKVVTKQAMNGDRAATVVRKRDLQAYNGVRRHSYGVAARKARVGVAVGLAWTRTGGELLNIEALAVAGKGRQIKTGSLGDIMRESVTAAITVVRSRAAALGIGEDFLDKRDLHIHVPEGATPKDGPSAGVGMCVALVSVLTGIPVAADVAMTGEITLRGQVLPVGGLKEKLLAAHRGGVKRVIIPQENERDLREVPANVLDDLAVTLVDYVDEVIDTALQRRPEPGAPALDAVPAKPLAPHLPLREH